MDEALLPLRVRIDVLFEEAGYFLSRLALLHGLLGRERADPLVDVAQLVVHVPVFGSERSRRSLVRHHFLSLSGRRREEHQLPKAGRPEQETHHPAEPCKRCTWRQRTFTSWKC